MSSTQYNPQKSYPYPDTYSKTISPKSNYDNYRINNPSITTYETYTTTRTPIYDQKVLEYSTPYDLNLKTEKVTRSGFSPERNPNYSYKYEYKPLEPKISYIYEEKPVMIEKKEPITYYLPEQPKVSIRYEEKPFLVQKTEPSSYDYHTYRPLDNLERISYSPVREKPKKANFYEYKIPEIDISSNLIYKLDDIKDNISELSQKLSNSPHKYQKDYYNQEMRRSSPLYINIERTDHIKKSGFTKSPLKSPFRSSLKSPLRSPLTHSLRSPTIKSPTTHKTKIFSPLNSPAIPDENYLMKSLETNRYTPIVRRDNINLNYQEKTKKHSLPQSNQQYSKEIVVPSIKPLEKPKEIIDYRVPLLLMEEQPKKSNLVQRRGTDDWESILCIDCEQYIKAHNANLHSMFCFKSIENMSRSCQIAKNDIRIRLRNISYFLNDEMNRIKKKGGFLEKGFWENCEELKSCLNDIVECRTEIEIHSHINRLHYANKRFDQVGGPFAQEIKRLGLRAEEDLSN